MSDEQGTVFDIEIDCSTPEDFDLDFTLEVLDGMERNIRLLAEMLSREVSG